VQALGSVVAELGHGYLGYVRAARVMRSGPLAQRLSQLDRLVTLGLVKPARSRRADDPAS
jgi:hypothetical protein